MSSELFVGNLPYTATQEDLTNHFSVAGEVESVKIITDRDTGRSKGFGFVKMKDEASAAKAIEVLNEKDFEGRNLKVNTAGGGERRSGQGAPRQGGGYGSRSGGPQGGPRGNSGDRRPRPNSW